MAHQQIEWTKPGPGSWELDTAHFRPECSRIIRDLMEAALPQGMTEGFALVGGPISTMECRFVNGRFYRRLVPVVGADTDRPPPPAAALWLACRLVPALLRSDKTAAAALADKIWLSELDRWETEWKPALVARSRELGRVEPAELDDSALADHIEQLLTHLREGTVLHFRLHTTDLGPIGLLLVKGADMGLSADEMMDALAGSSPATSAPSEAIDRLGDMVGDHIGPGLTAEDPGLTAEDPALTAEDPGLTAEDPGLTAEDPALTAEDPALTAEELRGLSTEVADAFDEFIAEFGWRLTSGYDIRDTTLAENPQVVVNAITARRGTGRSAEEAARQAGAQARQRLLAKVPEADRAELSTLIDDARATYGLRDENGPITFQWPAGLLRRAILVAGDRFHQAGWLPATAQSTNGTNDAIFDLTGHEIVELLRNGPSPHTPSVAEIDDRYQRRHGYGEAEAPRFLGPEPPDPALWALKPSSALLMRVVLEVVELLEVEHPEDPTTAELARPPGTTTAETAETGAPVVLRGVGIGDAPYTGVARVVTDDVEALSRINPGDVVVAPFTVPTYNSVLAIAGAVVTDNGGLLCHTAVIARELGIPAVVGTGHATGRIPDGATVVVDPSAATITVNVP